jgi:diguanylate cyclase (GGDEF)-like protein
MQKVLLIEDSRTFASVIKKTIEKKLHFPVDWVQTYEEATRHIDTHNAGYFVALVDLHLPDASKGEALDLVLTQKIPPIVLTGKFGDEIREYIWSKRVVDYVLKENPQSVDYVVSLVGRVYHNASVKILVVEDSAFSRKHLTQLLGVYQYQVLESKNGTHALKTLKEHPDIKLAIIDYYMPDMDGVELTCNIRSTHTKDALGIIGISAQGNNVMSAQFIKNGANDFITKPFVHEEFYCRVTQNIEMIEYMERIKQASHKDYLTDLYNRRYFFESGQLLYANALRRHLSIAVAMLDLDHFKQINDTYGHKAGDTVLQHVASLLKNRFRQTDIVARFGGEEFCVIVSNMELDTVIDLLNNVRVMIAQADIEVDTHRLRVTVSIGVCCRLKTSLEAMVNEADAMLYQAKKQGRNRVICL